MLSYLCWSSLSSLLCELRSCMVGYFWLDLLGFNHERSVQ